MKKTYKGLTLVEVLVSIAVFTIISLAMFSSLLAMTKVVALQEDYARIEMVCYDINAYWDMYGKDWDDYYFNRDSDTTDSTEGYLKYQESGFLGTTQETDYKVTYMYEENGHLVITSIYSFSKNREYLTSGGVNCGESKKANMEVTNE